MAQAIDAGIPKLRVEEAAARTQARIDSGPPAGDRRSTSTVSTADEEIEVRKVDNAGVRARAAGRSWPGCARSATTARSTPRWRR